MTTQLAATVCSIEVYPFEGGSYFISGGQIKSLTISKAIKGGGNGQCVVDLAPGGPFGPESSPDWTAIITPGSHILVGMQRGADVAIVFDGTVISTSETQTWSTDNNGSIASRNQRLVCADFAWFFNTQNWYSLVYYGLTAGTGLGGQLGYLPGSLIPLISKGLINGTPVEIGAQWFNVMAASGGMLGSTFVPYKGGNTRLPFSTLVAQIFENYPNVSIPFTEQFLGSESWMAKFQDIFPWPWYEFFVTTAPSGVYNLTPPPSGAAANTVVSGTAFSMQAFPTALPAGPQMVARVNPIPRFDFVPSGSSSASGSAPASGSVSPSQQYSIANINIDRWTALPHTDFSGVGFYSSSIEFGSDEARNFYMLNPTAYQTLFGNSGTSVVPYPFVFMGAADPASVHRYGFRPVNGSIGWFYDWQGLVSKQGLNVTQSAATLTAALASQWHPLPLMARGSVSIPLAPSVYIGTRFRYAPFKDGVIWEFYVESVSHRFAFGGQSSTTLALSRGLPLSVYYDTAADGLLQAIYTGNAQRHSDTGLSGIYQIGLPPGTGQGLQVFSSPQTAGSIAGQLSTAFVTPQTPSQ